MPLEALCYCLKRGSLMSIQGGRLQNFMDEALDFRSVRRSRELGAARFILSHTPSKSTEVRQGRSPAGFSKYRGSVLHLWMGRLLASMWILELIWLVLGDCPEEAWWDCEKVAAGQNWRSDKCDLWGNLLFCNKEGDNGWVEGGIHHHQGATGFR